MAYFATGNLDHNGQLYEAGQEVADLSEEQAAQLLAVNAVSETKPEVVATEAAPAVVEHPAELEQAPQAPVEAPAVLTDAPTVETPAQPTEEQIQETLQSVSPEVSLGQ